MIEDILKEKKEYDQWRRENCGLFLREKDFTS